MISDNNTDGRTFGGTNGNMPVIREEDRQEYKLSDYHKQVRMDFRRYTMRDPTDAEYVSKYQHPG